MKIYKWLFTIVLVLSLALPAVSVGAAPLQVARSATMYFDTPNPPTIGIGQEVTFNLVFSVANINPGVGGAEIYLSFNDKNVTPPTTPGTTAAEIRPDFFGVSTVSINEVLPAAQCLPAGGSLPCIHLVLAGPPQVNQIGVAVRFHFIGLNQGQQCFYINQPTLVDADGFRVDVGTVQPVCVNIVVSARGTGTVLRQGTPGNPNPGGGTLKCASVTASGPSNYGPSFTDTTGAFSIFNIIAGTYTFRATYPGYLPSEKSGVVVASNAQVFDIGTTSLRGGDVNNDNAINILDIGTIISKFGQTGSAVGSTVANCANPSIADNPIDVNDDGVINISDLAIAAGNWGKVGPTIWSTTP